jgi:hypothetical protein
MPRPSPSRRSRRPGAWMIRNRDHLIEPSRSSTGRLRSPRPGNACTPSSTTSSPSKTTAPGWPPMRDDHHRPVGQLTVRQLDLYGNQLTRCLKALGTDAPIRADVQRELATVRAEQEHRARPAADA